MGCIQEKLEHAERRCSKRGVRLTAKRKLVLNALLSSSRAVSAYDLIELCKREFDEVVPAMSMYRILDFLEEQEFAHKLNLANKYVACCHIGCDHKHGVSQFLICKECQKVEEISLGTITREELEHDAQAAGFQLVSPQLEVNCVCNECLDKVA